MAISLGNTMENGGKQNPEMGFKSPPSTTATLPIDRKLLETARDIRATQAGIRPENFRELNVAVAACESMVA